MGYISRDQSAQKDRAPEIMRHDSRWSDLKVLVTGGSGFIGGHLCRRLCDEGSEVHATSRNQRQIAGSGLIWWHADMADLATARRVLAAVRPNIVFHLAGSVGAAPDFDLVLPTYHSLLTSTVNVLVAATEVGCRRIFLTGSFTEPKPGEVEPTPAVSIWRSQMDERSPTAVCFTVFIRHQSSICARS